MIIKAGLISKIKKLISMAHKNYVFQAHKIQAVGLVFKKKILLFS